MRETQQVELEKRLPKLQKRFLQSFGIMHGPLLGLCATGVYVASQKDYFSPEDETIFAALLISEIAISLLGVGNFVEKAVQLNKVEKEIWKRKKTPLEQLAPLRKMPTENDRQEYLKLSPHLNSFLQLPSGEGNQERDIYSQISRSETVPEDSRVKAVLLLAAEFIDPKRKSRPRSDMIRTQMLDFVGRDIKRPVTSERGLPLFLEEEKLFFVLFDRVFRFEQAPETVCALARALSQALESYGAVSKLRQGTAPSKERINKATTNAVRAEVFVHVRSDIPAEILFEAQKQKKKEDARVLVTQEQAIDAAKKLVALRYRVQPEVREETLREIWKLTGLLEDLNTPETKEIRSILTIPARCGLDYLKNEDNFFHIPDEDRPSVKDGSITVVGSTREEADKKACLMALTYPIATQLTITVSSTKKTVSMTMDEFYKKRLIENRVWFLEDLISQQTFGPGGFFLDLPTRNTAN